MPDKIIEFAPIQQSSSIMILDLVQSSSIMILDLVTC